MDLGQNVPTETVQNGDVDEEVGGAFCRSLLPLVGPRQRLQTENILIPSLQRHASLPKIIHVSVPSTALTRQGPMCRSHGGGNGAYRARPASGGACSRDPGLK